MKDDGEPRFVLIYCSFIKTKHKPKVVTALDF